jgi:hypothetical protein
MLVEFAVQLGAPEIGPVRYDGEIGGCRCPIAPDESAVLTKMA